MDVGSCFHRRKGLPKGIFITKLNLLSYELVDWLISRPVETSHNFSS